MDVTEATDRAKRAGPMLALAVLAALAVLVVAAALTVSVLGLGTSPGKVAPPVMGPQQAAAIARAFYVAGHPADATLTDIVVKDVVAGTDKAGRAIWRVEIGGVVKEKGSTISYGSYMWLIIDAETRGVTIEAQG